MPALLLLIACGLSPFNIDWTPPTASDTEAQGTASASDSEPPVDTAADEISFIVFGDAGTGTSDQQSTATAMVQLCAREGCDFIVHLGSNLYQSGVESTDDEKFDDYFETPYSSLSGPFYMVLGDHDYGSNGNGYEEDRAQAQVDYTALSDKWVMEDRYWTTNRGPATLAFLDLVEVDRDDAEVQTAWTRNVGSNSRRDWQLAFGHYTYISNGRHGNAGEYQGITNPDDPNAGAHVKNFFDTAVCDKYHFYFAANDKNLQWPKPTCGTEFVVSGSGAATTPLENRGNQTYFESETMGLVYVVLTTDTATLTFYDQDLTELYSDSVGIDEAGSR